MPLEIKKIEKHTEAPGGSPGFTGGNSAGTGSGGDNVSGLCG